jgi:hypothetical protein
MAILPRLDLWTLVCLKNATHRVEIMLATRKERQKRHGKGTRDKSNPNLTQISNQNIVRKMKKQGNNLKECGSYGTYSSLTSQQSGHRSFSVSDTSRVRFCIKELANLVDFCGFNYAE